MMACDVLPVAMVYYLLLSWLQGPGRDASWCNGDCVWINSQCNPGDLLSVLLFL